MGFFNLGNNRDDRIMLDPKALEELKEIVSGFSGEFGPEILGLFVQLDAFIKKHEPKPPWPPEDGQEIFVLTTQGVRGTRFTEYLAEDKQFNENAYPTREMAEFVRDYRREYETVEYWEKKIEKAKSSISTGFAGARDY